MAIGLLVSVGFPKSLEAGSIALLAGGLVFFGAIMRLAIKLGIAD